MSRSGGWICSVAALLSLTSAVAHGHRGETETFHASAGHLLLLGCPGAHRHRNVTWSRVDGGLPAGVEVRDGSLWFLPVQVSHGGHYSCQWRGQRGVPKVAFRVSVSSGQCPDPPENRSIPVGTKECLPCKLPKVFRLNHTSNVRWMKDCEPVQPLSVEENGNMRLPAVAEKDAGKYTCLVDVTVGDRKYTAARSVRVTIDTDVGETVRPEPEMVFPQQDVVQVEVGQRAELKCLVDVGFSKDPETLMYWTMKGNFIEDYDELQESWHCNPSRGRVFCLSRLSISKVLRVHLNVPIHCNILSPAGQKSGFVLLEEADHSSFHTVIALCLTALLTALTLIAVFVFRVDLALACRSLSSHFPTSEPDGKLYDGYVSFYHPRSPRGSAGTEHFALQVLPGELEAKCGYSLFIRGRDDCPGEVLHDALADTVRRCRRLIIVLSPSSADGQTEEASSLRDERSQLCYEQKVGIHDALTHNEPRVVLVEIDGPVDYSGLPESLRYIRRKQGALKWTKDFLETNKLLTAHSNRRFWKNLRYQMPPVPAGRLQAVRAVQMVI